ncbi:MAG: NAD(P)-dependent oxidoreductase [Hyphomonas sp.]|uniref:NAD(P)-dependent oxidoreductase n=1 Tax=Hyphomonas sp. TaxID=87 RepID=UPI0017B06BB3|nr:NAD(P)-dependent oxidoreductase [Hyphomonas sp.]MBU3922564.1 NAD(P)-dependent oxidoreductase [Alphaproteobacteria bacterium]MBA3067129.1 NAD(P)-dependent oxidoreductase [Hyphomonas sp.]MBU4063075.1 NAD(P)-dependent oxidoreductase [Alphaproteobacteria bacterium]MBU4164392.1 NAD(P)-dependent oxidoreductase [Alphaproteobacteria bacterium]MBU4569546.1 NAD(P)-dependent oxidoreductase [Alphaproteobacteria bacterium]
MARTAFLGLGVMGFHMAGHLARAGHQVSVWNRTAAKSAAWAGVHRGEAAKDAASAVFGAEFVLMCLGDDPDVRAVFDTFEASLGAGMTVIDHTTASAGLARELAERCKAKGAHFIDAPVSGGEAGAINGKLTIMCGGEEAAFAAAEPVMNAFARKITLIGETGAGQLAKSVNQICIAGIVQGLAEGLHFAEKAGLDPAKVIEAISGGAAQSWQMENRWKTMTEGKFEFGFAVDWMRKDLRITLDAAAELGASLPMTATIDQYYADVQAMGGARWDTSSLIARLGK